MLAVVRAVEKTAGMCKAEPDCSFILINISAFPGEGGEAPWLLIERPVPSTQPTVLLDRERLRVLLSAESEHMPLMQRLEGAAQATAAMLDTLHGDMRLLVSTLGGEYAGAHMDAELMCRYFHRRGSLQTK